MVVGMFHQNCWDSDHLVSIGIGSIGFLLLVHAWTFRSKICLSSVSSCVSRQIQMWKWEHLNKYTWNYCTYRLPWDTKTLPGYIAEICVEAIVSVYFMIASFTPIVLFISINLHHQAFYKMVQHSIGELDSSDRNQNDQQLLCELIRFHMSAKEWAPF